MELADDFAKRIQQARTTRQWNQQQLAKKMAETVNIIKSAESGKRPTDSVVRKFERVLGIKLMVERTASESRFIDAGPSRHDVWRLSRRFAVIHWNQSPCTHSGLRKMTLARTRLSWRQSEAI